MKLRLVLAVMVALACSTLDASAQLRGRGYGGITVFDDPDFRGDNATFSREISDLRGHGLNDRVTSLEIDGNQAWEVCQDINFGGRCRVFSGSVEDLRSVGWNDRISSMRPAGYARGGATQGPWWGNRGGQGRVNASRLVFYDRPNFRGDSREVFGGGNNLGSIGDNARSVQVIGSGTWELCDGGFRNARCVTIDNSVSDLRSLGLRNGVTSIREVAGRNSNRSRWP